MQEGLEVNIASFVRPDSVGEAKLSSEARALISRTTYISNQDALRSTLRNPLGAARLLRESVGLEREVTERGTPGLRLMRAMAVADWVKANNIAHIHAHWPYGTQVAHLVHRLTGVPYSVSVHAHEVAHDAGHFPRIMDSVTFASFCNQAAMEYLLRSNPSVRERCHLIYHGVNLDKFPYREPSSLAPGDEFRIVSAGRLTSTKGFDRLIRFVAAAQKEGHNVTVEIIGDGPEKPRLQALADELGIAGRVSLAGWVSHDEIAERYARAHAFALIANTDFHDGLPNVVLEAMSSGLPVILSPLPSANEVIENGVNGFVLSDLEDVAGFVSAMDQFSAAGNIQAMSKAARATVVRDFDGRTQVKRLIENLAGGQ